MKKLNDEQRKLVEDNEGLIWYIGSKYIGRGYNPNEEYGELALGLCRAALSYNKDSGVKFSTYASAVLVNLVKTYFRSMQTNKRKVSSLSISLNQPVYEEDGGVLCIEDMLGTEYLEDSLVLFDLEDILNERELMVCKLRYQGMNQTEIANMLGITQVGVSRLLSKAKKKVKEAI